MKNLGNKCEFVLFAMSLLLLAQMAQSQPITADEQVGSRPKAKGVQQYDYMDNNTTGKFLQPVILLEHLDRLNNKDINALTSSAIASFIKNRNYDLVSLAFDDYNLDPRENSLLVKKLIMQVQNNKLDSGLPTIIIGQGPSGLLAHEAVKLLQNAGTTHGVAAIYTIDTPYQGMQYPAALEYFFELRKTQGDIPDSYQKYLDFLDTELYKRGSPVVSR